MHHVTLILVLAAAAQDPAAALVRNVEETLRSDPGIEYHHQGYMAHLASHPETAEAERAYAELSQLSDFRRVTAAFDEALLSDSASRTAFERYYAFLAESPGVRKSVDELFRLELVGSRGNKDLPRAFAFMRAYPDLALRFLAGPDRLHPAPRALDGARDYFAGRPEVREEFRGLLLGIHDQSLAHVSIFPWWRMAAREEGKAANAHDGLMGYLAANPHKFWVWHRRQTALAADPRAQKWIPYWYGRVRRHPDLKDTYWRYLSAVREQPVPVTDLTVPGDGTEKREPWPPEGDPPPLPPVAPDKARKPDPLSREALIPQEVTPPSTPDLPSVTEPRAPVMPVFPHDPEVPGDTHSSVKPRPENDRRRSSRIAGPAQPVPPTPPTPPKGRETESETRATSSP